MREEVKEERGGERGERRWKRREEVKEERGGERGVWVRMKQTFIFFPFIFRESEIPPKREK